MEVGLIHSLNCDIAIYGSTAGRNQPVGVSQASELKRELTSKCRNDK